MKISIITAVYNNDKTIACTMDSIQNQTYKNIEHIIIDGASTDSTLKIINSKKTAKTIVLSEKDEGIVYAWNKGIGLSSGEIIGLLNSDDFYASNDVIQKIIKEFEDETIEATYGDLHYVSSKDKNKVIRNWKSGSYSANKLKWGWIPPHPTFFLRKRVYDNFGLYNTSYKISMDYEAIIRYIQIGKIKMSYIPSVLVKMRLGGVSNNSIKSTIIKAMEDYESIRRYKIGGLMTLIFKRLSKISQFIKR